MAADLSIHALKGCTEADVRALRGPVMLGTGGNSGPWNEALSKVSATPQVWIGEVSWLKAALFGDADRFIPNVVQAIADAIGDGFPVLDETLFERLRVSLHAKGGGAGYSIASWEDVGPWLREHMGERLFTVSW